MTGAGLGWSARGPYIPRGHHASVLDTFVRSMVAALGWRAGSGLASLLGTPTLLVLAAVAVAWWVLRRRRARR